MDVGRIALEGLGNYRRDPLAAFSWPSDRHRGIVERLAAGWEVAVRAANQAAKTTTGAAWAIAVLRRETELAGVSLPLMERRVVGAVLVKGYKQASESSVGMLIEKLGTWPHHIERGSQNSVQSIWVRQRDNTDDDRSTWSRILVLPEDGTVPEGMRLDFAWADEPPHWPSWDALRLRGRANRPFPRLITFTPLDRAEWEPIRADFKGHAWPGTGRKVEVHLRLTDNRFLSDRHIEGLRRDNEGSEYADARLNGDYVDLTGACPFASRGLNRWLADCRDPLRTDRIDLGDGIHADLEVWEDPAPGEHYLITADPATGGLRDEKGRMGRYDPSCLHVVSRVRPMSVARFNGYLSSERLGRLAAMVGMRYRRALLCWEGNSGFGESFWIGARMDGRHYPNPYIERHHDYRRRPISERLGWRTTAHNRGVIIGALQTAIEEDSLYVPSRDAVESLSDVRMNHAGRFEAAPGRHDEDMICLGLACHLLATTPIRESNPRPHEPAWQHRGHMH